MLDRSIGVCLCVQPVCCKPWRCWSAPRCTRWNGSSICARCACVLTYRACPVESCRRRGSAWFDFCVERRWALLKPSCGLKRDRLQSKTLCWFALNCQCHNAEQLYIWLLHFIANNYLIFSHKPDFLELSGQWETNIFIPACRRVKCMTFDSFPS